MMAETKPMAEHIPDRRQQSLFDGHMRHKRCLRCTRRLHKDVQGRFRTRLAGLCFVCLREFENSHTWIIEKFCQEQTTDASIETPAP